MAFPEKYLQRCRLLASLSRRTWDADEHILRLARKSLLDRIAKYACRAWVPQTLETTLQKLERARNVSLRLQTGCRKPASVLRLRELTTTDPLREEATKSAAVLLERNARLHQSTPLLHQSGPKKSCRTKRSTAKEAGETRLAELGILPLGRLLFPVPRPHEAIKPLPGSVKFSYTDCAKSAPKRVRLSKARDLLSSLASCDLEIWTDGSVGSPTVPYPASQPWPISVRWEGKWYTATSTPLADNLKALDCVIRYHRKHKEPPSHVLFYDDGDTHAVHFRASPDQMHVVDEEGDSLFCHKPVFNTAGGSGCIIYDHRRRTTTKQKVAAGLVCTSFSAELRAAICAFEHALSNPRRNAHYRWIVDCQAVCTALSNSTQRDNTLIDKLHQLITSLMHGTSGSLDIVWISSHCGLQGNEEADDLAKLAVQLPLRDQLAVPVEFHDAKATIRGLPKTQSSKQSSLAIQTHRCQ